MTKPVLLTGLRANNDLHIGNYLGALLPLIDIAKTKSNDYQINLFVPDLHSFTTPIDHTTLQAQIIQNLRVFVAAGLPLDNPNVHVYRQSYVPAHSELAWILDCFVGFGELSRMTEFKDKSTKLGHDHIGVGQFNYPVLMAADILLYGARYIPVGDDQRQHIEFTRTIAERFNNRFGDIFVVPQSVKDQHDFFGKDQGIRIKDLVDPTKKMSKSDDTGKGVIFLLDTPEIVRKKIMSATTDSLAMITYDPEHQPGIANLIDMIALFNGHSTHETVVRYSGQTQYGSLKADAADVIGQFLAKFQLQLSEVNDDAINAKLVADEIIMNQQANATLYKVQQAVGLRPEAAV